jgi:hypothetical protein
MNPCVLVVSGSNSPGSSHPRVSENSVCRKLVSEKPVYRKPTFREYLLCQATAIRRASATTVVALAASVILPADGPRITPSAHRGTKPQMPCSDQFCSASLSYRPTLSGTAFCNPIPPAHSCRHVRPLIPLISPTTIVRAAPSISALSLNPVTFYYEKG